MAIFRGDDGSVPRLPIQVQSTAKMGAKMMMNKALADWKYEAGTT